MIQIKSITNLLIGVIELIILIAILAGVTPSVLVYFDNLSNALVSNGLALGSLLAVSALGGILWFALVILIIIGVIFLMIKSTKGGK